MRVLLVDIKICRGLAYVVTQFLLRELPLKGAAGQKFAEGREAKMLENAKLDDEELSVLEKRLISQV